MSSFLEKAKRSIAKNQDLLNVFEEYDRTGKLRKINYKTRVNFTVDENLFNNFRSYCKRNTLNMSAKIESYMKKELEKKK
jgi:predicted flavoprotein YhiN